MVAPSQETNHRLSELMRKGQEGDARAYEELLKESSQLVAAFVGKRIPDSSGVDDVVQEVLMSVHRVRHTYDPARPFKPWLYAITRYRLADYFRRVFRQAKREIGVEMGEIERAPAEDRSEIAEWGEVLSEAMAELPEKQQIVLRALKYEGLSVREVSERHQMSESAVKVTAHRAYKTLRKTLGGWVRGDE